METAISHQTVRLARGKHTSPRNGVCVMELASMLAGEDFTDHPKSVCPALGAILRPYNDALDDVRRQDLYAYAARVVGTHGDRALTRRRVREALEFFEAHGPRPIATRWQRLLPGARLTALAHATARFARAGDARTHALVLTLLDRLLALGGEGAVDVEAAAFDPRHRAVDVVKSRADA